MKVKLDVLFVLATVFAPPALQAGTTIDVVNQILSTERIFSAAFIFILIFLGRQVWPWYTKQNEAKQKMDFDYRMSRLAAEERQEERQGDLMERLITSHSEIKESLVALDTQVAMVIKLERGGE